MRRPAYLFGVAVAALVMSALPEAQTPVRTAQAPALVRSSADDASRYAGVIKQYCAQCHNARVQTSATASGVLFDTIDLQNVSRDAVMWEKVVRKLRAGAMPPAGMPHPDAATHEGLLTWLEARLDAAAATPNPGRPILHRLNRTEYRNAIRDLLALDIGDVSSLLPPDDSAYGFDKIADFLGVSQVLLERYLSAAGRISALAVGSLDVVAGSDTYTARQDLSQDRHVDGMPFGTVGGIKATHTFPVDGDYVIQATLYRTNVDQTRGLEHTHQVEIAVDGERVFLHTIGGTPPGNPGGVDEAATGRGRLLSRSDAIDAQLQVQVPVKAGPRVVTAAFLQRSRAADSRKMQPYRSSFDTYDATGYPHIRTLVVKGPFRVDTPGDTPSRARIFTCRPTAVAQEEPCARQILTTLVRRAYRQPASAQDVNRAMDFYRGGRADGGSFDTGIQLALQRVLASPKFVLRVERDPATVPAGAAYRVSDVELASRLSFFLWSSIPDDELLALAAKQRLSDPAVLEQQVRRMLRDERSRALVDNFASQWLQLRNLQRVTPDNDLFPEFDDNLRQGFRREVELLFDAVMREDRSVLELLTADFTFVDERVARHYGIPGVYGSQFRRVAVTDDVRKGLLGKGAILAVTSNADRTSPVVRGKWILDNLQGMPPPSPPANVPALEESAGTEPKSMRDQMAAHRANPVCASCHKLMDPIGLALENFDAIGRWRTKDAAGPIDASGDLIDGTHVDGVVQLREALLKRPEVFVGTFTEKLMTYALERGVDAPDMPTVRRIVREGAARNYRFSSLVLGVVKSPAFQMRLKAQANDAALTTAQRLPERTGVPKAVE
jgi:mono/diheme cytochrome c family protein